MKRILLFIFIGLFVINSCKKDKSESPAAQETGTVTDVEGNVYKTVKIGNQWWMAQDLKVTKYRDGTSINLIQDTTSLWSSDTSGAYCRYENYASAPGLLYNWFAIKNAANIAPSGWHIPSDDEWKQLEEAIGMSGSQANQSGWRGTNEGEKIKTTADNAWTRYQNVWNTNESGFSATAGGCRLPNKIGNTVWSEPDGLTYTGFWWTSSPCSGNSEAWYRYLDYKNANVFRSHTYFTYGFSIRCVKD